MEIVRANDRGVSVFRNGTSVPSWSFGQSFFFSSTVVTTIGKDKRNVIEGRHPVLFQEQKTSHCISGSCVVGKCQEDEKESSLPLEAGRQGHTIGKVF